MQCRTAKAPKREMVIESPQQYKSLAEIEAEVEGVPQVPAVSMFLFRFVLNPSEATLNIFQRARLDDGK